MGELADGGRVRGSDYDAALAERDKRIEELSEALGESMCPYAFADNADERVDYCVAHGQCGCGMTAVLAKVSSGDTKP